MRLFECRLEEKSCLWGENGNLDAIRAFRPLLNNGTGPFFPTSAARRQRSGKMKQRPARVRKDFL